MVLDPGFPGGRFLPFKLERHIDLTQRETGLVEAPYRFDVAGFLSAVLHVAIQTGTRRRNQTCRSLNRTYLPLNAAARFSKNAARPSVLSSLSHSAAKAVIS